MGFRTFVSGLESARHRRRVDQPQCTQIFHALGCRKSVILWFCVCSCLPQHQQIRQQQQLKTTSDVTSKFLGPAFGRTDFSRIFLFVPPDFFADFLAGFFLIFAGKSAQINSLEKSPGKSSKMYTTKILRHISADWPGQKFCWCCRVSVL